MQSLCSNQQANAGLLRRGNNGRLLHLRRSARHQLVQVLAQASSSSNGAPVASTSTAPAQRDYSVSLFDALKFNGPAPELVNGRLAMVGLVAGAWEEVQSGTTLAQQAGQLPLAELLLLAVWVYASLVPILKGAKMESFGWFTPRAEITNGRAAMLGIAVLLFLEAKAGVPFF